MGQGHWPWRAHRHRRRLTSVHHATSGTPVPLAAADTETGRRQRAALAMAGRTGAHSFGPLPEFEEPVLTDPAPYLTGDRGALIQVSVSAGITSYSTSTPQNLVNGNTGNNVADSWAAGAAFAWAGEHIRFAMLESVQLSALLWRAHADATSGFVKVQGSNDLQTFVDLTASTALQTVSGVRRFDFAPAAQAEYAYYQLTGVGGTCSAAPWYQEVEFEAPA